MKENPASPIDWTIVASVGDGRLAGVFIRHVAS